MEYFVFFLNFFIRFELTQVLFHALGQGYLFMYKGRHLNECLYTFKWYLVM